MRFRWKQNTSILFIICSDAFPITKYHINPKINTLIERTDLSLALTEQSPQHPKSTSTMCYCHGDLAMSDSESFVFFSRKTKRDSWQLLRDGDVKTRREKEKKTNLVGMFLPGSVKGPMHKMVPAGCPHWSRSLSAAVPGQGSTRGQGQRQGPSWA